MSLETINWSALEYEEKTRNSDWFWALGIIVATSAIASIIFENYSFAALLILAGTLLGFFANKKPEIISYELNDRGLKIKNRLYQLGDIKSFWVQGREEVNPDLRPMLFIKSERAFLPILTIPLEHEVLYPIYNFFSAKNIPEEKMEEHISEMIMDYFGF